MPLRLGSRRNDHAGRSGARMERSKQAAARRQPRRRVSRARASSSSNSKAAHRGAASACGRRRAPSRQGAQLFADRIAAEADRHRHLGRFRPERRGADRHGLCAATTIAASGTRRLCRAARRARAGARSPSCLSSRRPTSAEARTGRLSMLKFTPDHEWLLIDERCRHGRHHPTTRRSSWATWSSSSCRSSAPRCSQARVAAVVESVKAASDVYAPVGGEVVEVNEALIDDPTAGQFRSDRQAAGSSR